MHFHIHPYEKKTHYYQINSWLSKTTNLRYNLKLLGYNDIRLDLILVFNIHPAHLWRVFVECVLLMAGLQPQLA